MGYSNAGLLCLCLLPLIQWSWSQSTPVICEDSIAGQPPFNSDDVPCILGCSGQVYVATGSLLPGSINETAIPYCLLNCVRKDVTPSQSAAAPSCHQKCQMQNSLTPENLGWCMYWCVDGFPSVASTMCVPSLEFAPATTTLEGGETATIDVFTNPPAWLSWYNTQTVLSRTGYFNAMPSTAMSVEQTSSDLSASSIPTSSQSLSTPGGISSTGTAAAESTSRTQESAPNSIPSSASKTLLSVPVLLISTIVFYMLRS